MVKQNKSIGCHGLNGNIIMDVYDSIKVILFKDFKASLEEAAFPEKLYTGCLYWPFENFWYSRSPNPTEKVKI